MGRFISADSSVSTGQGLLGNNMFTYCLNSPTNGCDPCGTCFHRWDFWNDCEYCDKHGWCGTASAGISGGFNLGPFTFAGQLSIVTDLNGDSEIQFSYAVPISTDTQAVPEMMKKPRGFSAALTANMTFTNARDVTRLQGIGHQVGASFGGAALDINYIPSQQDNTTYSGITFSGGIASPDVHYTMSNTVTVARIEFNLFEFCEELYKRMWGIYW